MKRFLILLFALSFSRPVFAAYDASTPDGLIMNTAEQVLKIIRQDNSVLTDTKRLRELVDIYVLPHFDFTRMTRLAVGRPWRTATEAQKSALTTEFRSLLIRTYSKVYSTYSEPEIVLKSVRYYSPSEAKVETVITVANKEPVTVAYEMKKAPSGWKVFDVIVEGISLVTSYRAAFSDQIQRDGIDGLIRSLAEKNQAAALSETK